MSKHPSKLEMLVSIPSLLLEWAIKPINKMKKETKKLIRKAVKEAVKQYRKTFELLAKE
jgi:hypothetical protein